MVHVNEASSSNGRWPGFGEEWEPFIQAWNRYGFKYPPTKEQREKLWEIVDARPTSVSLWIDEAPRGLQAFDLIGYLFKLFVGDEYRVDVSSEAGDRWDKF